MMGEYVEGIISGIEAVKDAAVSAIIALSSATAYKITSMSFHGGLSEDLCSPVETEVPYGDAMASVNASINSMSDACSMMRSMGSDLYVGTSGFNNSVGSPWTELSKLQDGVTAAAIYSGGASPLNYVGDKAGMLAMLNMVLTLAVDAKQAIIYYHDYIQRGFDTLYNGNTPSVTWSNGLNGKQSTGQVDQQFSENVHIPKPSIDPF